MGASKQKQKSQKTITPPTLKKLDHMFDSTQTTIPYSLYKNNCNPVKPTKEQTVNDIVSNMNTELDHQLKSQKRKRGKHNLSLDEREGLKWLEKMTSENKISIVPADKGGAILIVYPDLLRRKVLEKLENKDLYQKLDKDPTPNLYKELFDLWLQGKEKELVSAHDAKTVLGVSNNERKYESNPINRPSTCPHFIPGRPTSTRV